MAQSVIDELENLDLDGAVKKASKEDDDFDYVYHLPHANLKNLPERTYDPFKEFMLDDPEREKKEMAMTRRLSVANSDTRSRESIANSKTLLHLGEVPAIRKLSSRISGMNDSRTNVGHSSTSLINQDYSGGFQFNTSRSRNISRAGSRTHSIIDGLDNLGRQRSNQNEKNLLSLGGMNKNGRPKTAAKLTVDSNLSAMNNRISNSVVSSESRSGSSRIFPDDVNLLAGSKQSAMNEMDELAAFEETPEDNMLTGPPSFKALPPWVTKRISSKMFATICLIIVTSITVSVILYDFIELGLGNDVVSA